MPRRDPRLRALLIARFEDEASTEEESEAGAEGMAAPRCTEKVSDEDLRSDPDLRPGAF